MNEKEKQYWQAYISSLPAEEQAKAWAMAKEIDEGDSLFRKLLLIGSAAQHQTQAKLASAMAEFSHVRAAAKEAKDAATSANKGIKRLRFMRVSVVLALIFGALLLGAGACAVIFQKSYRQGMDNTEFLRQMGERGISIALEDNGDMCSVYLRGPEGVTGKHVPKKDQLNAGVRVDFPREAR
jgi:hypothetical protein